MTMDADRLDRIADALLAAHTTGSSRQHGLALPNREAVADLCRRFLSLLFPGFFTKAHLFCGHVATYTRQNLLEAEEHLLDQVRRATLFAMASTGCEATKENESAIREQVGIFLNDLPSIAEIVATDVEAAFENDPAAANKEEIIAAYPGLENCRAALSQSPLPARCAPGATYDD